MTQPSSSTRLAESWVHNAHAWTDAVRSGAIPSRRAGTDEAILQAIAHAPDGALLDVGCGEGWLSRAIATQRTHRRTVVGIDASAPLIAAARLAGTSDGHSSAPSTATRNEPDNGLINRPRNEPRYEHVSYAELADRAVELGAPFAVAVCNFALLDDNVADALTAIRTALSPLGTLFIQTAHPFTARGDGPYENGWREETFDAFGGRFPAAMPWYFRTVGSWVAELQGAGFVLESVAEPRSAEAPMPLSLLMRARRAGGL